MTRRHRNAAATSDALLASARRRFLEESYENVGLRDIAADAGVDVALVSRYFGSKEALFRKVLRGARGDWLDGDVSSDELPRWLAQVVAMEDQSGNVEDIERLLIILRSASSPKAARIVQDSFREDVLDPVARLIPGEESEVRASVALCVLIGTTVLRSIMRVDAIRACDAHAMRGRLESVLAAALSPGAEARASQGEA